MPIETVQMRKKQLPYLFAAVLLAMNAIPCSVNSGTRRWFVKSVPEPERFTSAMRNAPSISLVFGFPFAWYSRSGRAFTRKGGDKLFWPSDDQGALRERFSLSAIIGNLTVAVGSGALLKLIFVSLTRLIRKKRAAV